jgi:hypothetical protein
MEFTGRVTGVSTDFITGKYSITLEVNEGSVIRDGYDAVKDVDKLDVKMTKYRKKRSLDANAYYWQLLTKFAQKQDMSIPFAHNYFLRRYGQIEIFDGKAVYVVIPDTDEAEEKIFEADTYHLRPTSQVKEGKDGVMYRTYMMLRGSSDYDTKEMSKLIDGLVTEAKENGIETLPPEELERMKAMWKEK